MRIQQRTGTPRTAVAAVEFAVTAPLLLLLLTGVWEVGRMVYVKQIISNAAREGARAASSGSFDYAAIQSRVRNYVRNSGLLETNVVVEVKSITNNTGPNYSPTNASQLDELEVYVSIPFNDVRWAALDQITSIQNIEATSRWYSAKDVPIVIDLSGSGIPKTLIK